MVRAFDQLRDPPYLLIVGEGPERAELEARGQGSRMPGRITMAGFVLHDRGGVV